MKITPVTSTNKYQPWMSPFPPQVLGTLRGKINQFTDPTGTILTPKQIPKSTAVPFTYISA